MGRPTSKTDLISAAHINFEKFNELIKGFNEHSLKLLELVTESYFGMTGYELERLTHNEDPWNITREGLAEDEPSNKVIDKDLIRKYYQTFIQDGSKS